MMKNNSYSFWLIGTIGLMLILGNACCKDDDDSGEDKCKDEVATNADFSISTRYLFDSTFIEGDTFALPKRITFKALYPLDSVEWKIGLEAGTRTGNSIVVIFDEGQTGNVTIRMIGRKTPNLDCFPGDNGIDTVTKKITLVPLTDVPLYGEYEGYVQSKPDSIFVFSIGYSNSPHAFLQNFPNGCERTESEFGVWTVYRDFYMADPTNDMTCAIPQGWGHLDKNHRDFRMEYVIWNHALQKHVEDVFIGKKLN